MNSRTRLLKKKKPRSVFFGISCFFPLMLKTPTQFERISSWAGFGGIFRWDVIPSTDHRVRRRLLSALTSGNCPISRLSAPRMQSDRLSDALNAFHFRCGASPPNSFNSFSNNFSCSVNSSVDFRRFSKSICLCFSCIKQ